MNIQSIIDFCGFLSSILTFSILNVRLYVQQYLVLLTRMYEYVWLHATSVRRLGRLTAADSYGARTPHEAGRAS